MATMILRQRYASAVHSKSLTVDEKTTYSDTDVLGAHGLADRNLARGHDGRGRSFTPAPLAVPLERLFSGDHKASHEIVRILAEEAFIEARRWKIQLNRVQAHDMACAVLAWFQHGTCQPCGGRGFPIIKDSPIQSAHECEYCAGSGKIPLRKQFRQEWKDLADWLKDKMEAESGKAGVEAMKLIAARMDL